MKTRVHQRRFFHHGHGRVPKGNAPAFKLTARGAQEAAWKPFTSLKGESEGSADSKHAHTERTFTSPILTANTN